MYEYWEEDADDADTTLLVTGTTVVTYEECIDYASDGACELDGKFVDIDIPRTIADACIGPSNKIITVGALVALLSSGYVLIGLFVFAKVVIGDERGEYYNIIIAHFDSYDFMTKTAFMHTWTAMWLRIWRMVGPLIGGIMGLVFLHEWKACDDELADWQRKESGMDGLVKGNTQTLLSVGYIFMLIHGVWSFFYMEYDYQKCYKFRQDKAVEAMERKQDEDKKARNTPTVETNHPELTI